MENFRKRENLWNKEECDEDLKHEMHSDGVGPFRPTSWTSNPSERSYLIAVERGDLSTVRNFLDHVQDNFDVNCVDPLGRSALRIAIENDHNEMLWMLLHKKLELGDSLLHAISEDNVEAVEMIIEAMKHQMIEKQVWNDDFSPSEAFERYRRLEAESSPSKISSSPTSSAFTSDITPIILAAHRDNFEIIKILLDRGDHIDEPHDLQCACATCQEAQKCDSLKHSKARIYAFRALASPCLIALSSKDPILTAFELSWVLRRLGNLENEFRIEYEELMQKCQEFALGLLEQTRSSDELALILNHTNGGEYYRKHIGQRDGGSSRVEANCLARLKLAIKYKQKKFVAHPHCQQLLASLWYEGLPGFRRSPIVFKAAMIVGISLFFPFLCVLYLATPRSTLGRLVKKPFIKFLCHSASYFLFLVLLILAALRIGNEHSNSNELHGFHPTMVEILIVIYVAGFVWNEIKQLWSDGVYSYVRDMWNLLDFATNSLYVATITLRLVAFYLSNKHPTMKSEHRTDWGSYHPILVSECLFAAANIFSTLKLVFIFTVNPHLGPIQISLGRMLNDILKFFCVYMLVLVAFACGLNQLLWFYANRRRDLCRGKQDEIYKSIQNGVHSDSYAYCTTKARYFTSLFEIVQSLYWSTYGLIELSNLNLEFPHEFTEFIGKLMFGTFSWITTVVLLNMLIAMMNNSYLIIAESADTEWKFSRTKLWLSYFADGNTLPVPFNIIPSIKSILSVVYWCQTMCLSSKANKHDQWYSIRKICERVNEMEENYQKVMQNLVQRYLNKRQRASVNEGVTEDDLNEIKTDISAFRYELLDILKVNGMAIPPRVDIQKGICKSKSRRVLSRISKSYQMGTEQSVNSFGTCFEENNCSANCNTESSQWQQWFHTLNDANKPIDSTSTIPASTHHSGSCSSAAQQRSHVKFASNGNESTLMMSMEPPKKVTFQESKDDVKEAVKPCMGHNQRSDLV